MADPVSQSALAPTEAQALKRATIGVVITAADEASSPEAAIASLGEACHVVFVTGEAGSETAAIARRAGANVAALAEELATPGRARNAGYRHLKKLQPDLDYVQFLDARCVLDPDWFETAEHFLARRPEVAVIEGELQERAAAKSIFSHAVDMARDRTAGEIQATGPNAFFRAGAFETAGGFRGDIAVNETEDLCIRLRRRGAHIWRVETEMAVCEADPLGPLSWWRGRLRAGYANAAGAALHGAPPEQFAVAAQSRAMFWGMAFPLGALFMGGVGALSASMFASVTGPMAMFATIVGLALAIYAARIVMTAVAKGPSSPAAWRYGVLATIGRLPEAIGAARYIFSGKKTKRRSAKA